MEKNKIIFLSSAKATQADLANGSASFQFQNPFEINNAQIGLFEFGFTNFFINISSALGNNKFYYSDEAGDNTKYELTIPDGSYSLISLNDLLSYHQKSTVGSIIFTLHPNYSTNKIAVVFGDVSGWYIHFSANSPFTLCGFTSGQDIPFMRSNTAFYREEAPNVAQFNNITLLKVSCDLTTDSVSDGKSSSVIFQTSPTVEVGSTQSDRPNTIAFCDLTTTRFSSIKINILDQLDRSITLSEHFSVSLIIRYMS